MKHLQPFRPLDLKWLSARLKEGFAACPAVFQTLQLLSCCPVGCCRGCRAGHAAPGCNTGDAGGAGTGDATRWVAVQVGVSTPNEVQQCSPSRLVLSRLSGGCHRFE